jgi:osmotically-inducible protein OsmY
VKRTALKSAVERRKAASFKSVSRRPSMLIHIAVQRTISCCRASFGHSEQTARPAWEHHMNNDIHLQASVLAELNWEPSVTAAHIGVTASDGLVSLSGHVDSYGEKHAAELAAGRVKGVKAIVEGIEVRLPFDHQRADNEIAEVALQRLAWHVADPDYTVKVKVEKGWLTLTGQVAWHFQKEAAESELRRLQGVTGLDNQITIKPTVSVCSVSDDIIHALHRSWFFDPNTVCVSADQGTVRLTGTVRTPQDRQLAAAIAWAAPGVTAVENNLAII